MNDNSLQGIAALALRQEHEVARMKQGGEIARVRRPLGELLAADHLPGVLFDAWAPTREERASVYGFGNEDIDLRFKRLKRSLVLLAAVGERDPKALREGEDALESLIRGVTELEREAKVGVNPREAAHAALEDRRFRAVADRIKRDGVSGAVDPDGWMGAFLQGLANLPSSTSGAPVTPNEIDAEQSISLFHFQSLRSTHAVLDEILRAVRRINRVIEKEDSGPAKSSPSR